MFLCFFNNKHLKTENNLVMTVTFLDLKMQISNSLSIRIENYLISHLENRNYMNNIFSNPYTTQTKYYYHLQILLL